MIRAEVATAFNIAKYLVARCAGAYTNSPAPLNRAALEAAMSAYEAWYRLSLDFDVLSEEARDTNAMRATILDRVAQHVIQLADGVTA